MNPATKKIEVSIDRLRERVSYDPETGDMFWKDCEDMFKSWRTRMVGKPAFNIVSRHGYKIGSYCDRMMQAHRVIWALHYGEWPVAEIDHINRDRGDNRISNLRDVSRGQNARNTKTPASNTSGEPCVFWNKDREAWAVICRYDKRRIFLGYHTEKQSAVRARNAFWASVNHPKLGAVS